MLTHGPQPAAAAEAVPAGAAASAEGATPQAAETKIRIARVTPAGAATVAGAAGGALGLTGGGGMREVCVAPGDAERARELLGV